MSLAPSCNAALNRCEKRELMCSINATESIFKTILLNRASYCALWEVIMMHAVHVYFFLSTNQWFQGWCYFQGVWAIAKNRKPDKKME